MSQEGEDDPLEGKLLIEVTRHRSGAFSVDIDGDSSGTEAVSFTRTAAITRGLRQLSEFNGVTDGLCVQCLHPLTDTVGALVHEDCVHIVDCVEGA